MKRMVKNGDLIDVEPDGTITVAGKPVGGGGGGSGDKVLTLTMPYPRNLITNDMFIYLDDEIWNKINNCEYETIKIYFNDGTPLGIFNLFYYYYQGIYNSGDIKSQKYTLAFWTDDLVNEETWYGSKVTRNTYAEIECKSDSKGKFIRIYGYQGVYVPFLTKSKFDALYKLADKPTQDGTYILKATVSGGAVTYTWVTQ